MTLTCLKIGTRKSPLALAQAEQTKAEILKIAPGMTVELVHFVTSGDKFLEQSLANIGGKGLFTKEIEEALLSGEIDLAVHSMKDMPTVLPEGLIIPCLLEREDVRDAFISSQYKSIEDLPEGAVVGTTALRRQAQLLSQRPDLEVITFRGNINSRLRKVKEGEVAATFLAMAGLKRINLTAEITKILSVEEMLPAVAQGAIGIECRADRLDLIEILSQINHAETAHQVLAERKMLEMLDGSCRTPIGAHSELDGGKLTLQGLVASPDGGIIIRDQEVGSIDDAEEIGMILGKRLKSQSGAGLFDVK